MWSAHPQGPRASCEANIAKWTARLGAFPEGSGETPVQGERVCSSPGPGVCKGVGAGVSYSKYGTSTWTTARQSQQDIEHGRPF